MTAHGRRRFVRHGLSRTGFADARLFCLDHGAVFGTRSHEATNDAPGTLRAFVSSCEAISQTAQAILDARARYPDASLADLYDELTMPPELRRAHQENDRAVMRAYGFDVKSMTESACVAALMRLYQEKTGG